MKDVDAELERSKLFISACGAFSGGAAKANISQAKALHDDGVNVNHVDNDGYVACNVFQTLCSFSLGMILQLKCVNQ